MQEEVELGKRNFPPVELCMIFCGSGGTEREPGMVSFAYIWVNLHRFVWGSVKLLEISS